LSEVEAVEDVAAASLSAHAGAAATKQAPAIAAPIHRVFTRHPSPNFISFKVIPFAR
jgi:hypothetical protein